MNARLEVGEFLSAVDSLHGPNVEHFDLTFSSSDTAILQKVGIKRSKIVGRKVCHELCGLDVMKQGFAFTEQEVKALIQHRESALLKDGSPNLLHILSSDGNIVVLVLSWIRANGIWRKSTLEFGFSDRLGAGFRWESGTRVVFKTTATWQPRKEVKKRILKPGVRQHRRRLN